MAARVNRDQDWHGTRRRKTHFPFPNQFPTHATTAGQPVVCTSPLHTWRDMGSITHKHEHCFGQLGWKTATPVPKLLRKHSVCLVFFSAGAILGPLALLPWLNWEWLVLPNQLPVLAGDGHTPGFDAHTMHSQVLQGVEMPSAPCSETGPPQSLKGTEKLG